MRKFILSVLAMGLASLAYADNGTDATDDATQDAQVAVEAGAQKSHCLRHTGSRIRKSGECLALPGRAYSGDDLKLTGEINPADALSRLDPSLQTRGR
jgi:hypothetical protein